jgi:adenine-specific DNA-methyltransferase
MTDQLTLFGAAPPPARLRPVHYLGSKARLLDVIEDALDEVAPAGPVCDLFSGSGVVAGRLARCREVVAVDIQEYARVLASALLRPARITAPAVLARLRDTASLGPLRELIEHERACLADAAGGRPDALCAILEQGSIVAECDDELAADPELARRLRHARTALPPGPDTVLTRYYGGVYFSYAQAAALDAIAAVVRRLPGDERDTALAALLGTASDVVTSIGNHFAQPVRPRTRNGGVKPATVAAVTRRRALDVTGLFAARVAQYAVAPRPGGRGTAIRADYRDALRSLRGVAAVYADPPYTRDHYSRFYHVLETMALGDSPVVSTSTIGGRTGPSRGLYRAERHQSPFCIKSSAPQAFAALFEGVADLGVPLVLSYSPYADGHRPRLMTMAQIEALAAAHFDDVEVRSAGRMAHSKLNAERVNAAASYDAEILVLCRSESAARRASPATAGRAAPHRRRPPA